MKAHIQNDSESYFSRNQRWLQPAIAGLILLLAPFLVASFSNEPLPFPAWLPKIAAALAFVLAGIFAAMCETFSALVVRILAQIVAVTLLVWSIFIG